MKVQDDLLAVNKCNIYNECFLADPVQFVHTYFDDVFDVESIERYTNSLKLNKPAGLDGVVACSSVMPIML